MSVFEQLYTIIIQNTLQLISCDSGGMALIDKRGRGLRVEYAINAHGFSVGTMLEFGSNEVDRFFTHLMPRRIPDELMGESPFRDIARSGMGPTSIVPLISRGHPLGVMWIARRPWQQLFNDYDIVLLDSIGAQAAVAIDNLQLLEAQRFISESLQRGFLPERLPRLKNTEIGVFYESATSAATVGGDFYDAVTAPDDSIRFFVGDVSGKGVEATADAAMLKYTLRTLFHTNPDASYVMTEANSIATEALSGGHFITLFYGSFSPDSGELNYSIAGHPYPVHYSKKKGVAVLLEHDDPAIAIVQDYQYPLRTISMEPGDVLLLYSDGITELRRDDEFFGDKRLEALVADIAGKNAQDIADTIISSGREFARGRLTDDIVILVIKRVP